MPILDSQQAAHHPSVGGKARALGRLGDGPFDVPPFVVVSPDEPWPIAGLEIRAEALGPGPYAVRSSAVVEDGSAHSFAGQFRSVLSVSKEDLQAAVADVRASAEGPAMRAYTESRGIESAIPAAIIQPMVRARAAGVAFSADVIHGRRARTIVSAVPGLGEALVSGESNADSWEVTTDAEINNLAMADKSPCLDTKDVLAVAALARSCEKHFGIPQDIEWAIDDTGKLWLLQSRPITTLGDLPDPDDSPCVWDNSNIVESYGGVTTPLTFSFARKAYEHVYREFCAILGVTKAGLARGEEVFPKMLGLVHGRVYYNLLSWYRVLALLPGFTLNRSFMEQMMGVKEPLPDELVARVIAEATVSPWQDRIAVVRGITGIIRQAFALPGMKQEFLARLDNALHLDKPLAGLSAEDLARHYRGLEDKLLRRWDAPLVNDFFAMITYGVLRSWCKSWAGDESGTAQNTLLVDQGGIISAEPAIAIRAMGDLLSANVYPVHGPDARTPRHAIASVPGFREAWDNYLERFGDRCLEELKLESPTLRDDATLLWNAVLARAANPQSSPVKTKEDSGIRAAANPVVALAARVRNPMKRTIFRWMAGLAARRVRDRENLRFERTRLFGHVRSIFRELGRRFAADQRLESPDDIFYLEAEEALGLLDGTTSTQDAATLVRVRRAEFERFRAEPAPPDRFTTRGPLHRNTKAMTTSKVLTEQITPKGNSMTGTGASPGVVRGHARVVTDPREANLQPGEILVARQTDPGWVMLFPIASGLLVEKGSLLSHSAIVSRELGLPCIVGLTGICSWLRDGDEVEMDGASGLVNLLRRNEADSSAEGPSDGQ
ncbi:MAG: PEP/pyruvate-binding domain-containing protein [Verrucomicrobiales bacterium]